MSIEARKLALEALKIVWEEEEEISAKAHQVVFKAIKALEESLAKQDQWWVKELEGFWGDSDYQVTLDTRRAAKTALTVIFDHPQPKQEQGEPDDLMIAYMSGLHDGKKAAKQEQGEPVAEVVEDYFSKQVKGIGRWHALPNGTKLYTTPQQRTWVGLTNEERHQVMQDRTWMHTEGLCQAIEAKLKEKNT